MPPHHPLRSSLTSVETPEDSLNQRFETAKAQLLGLSSGSIPDERLIPALLAIGDHGGALDRLRALRASGGPGAEVLACFAAWTGDQRWLARLGADVLRDVAGIPKVPERAGESAPALWRSTPAEMAPSQAAELVLGVVGALWRVAPNAAGESVAVEPALPRDWRGMALRQLRVGETLLDIAVRQSRAGIAVSVQRRRGPAIRLVLTLPGVMEFEVDGQALSGGRAVFRVEGEHGVTART